MVTSEAFVVDINGDYETVITHPCVAFETSVNIHRILTSVPTVVELNYASDIGKIYEGIYGQGAVGDDRHNSNYECVKLVVPKTTEVIRGFIVRLDGLLDYRASTYLSNGTHHSTEERERAFNQNKDRMRRDLTKFRSTQNTDFSNVTFTQFESDTLNSVTKIEELNERLKRGLNVAPFIISILALSGVIGSTIVLANKYEKLLHYVQDLDRQITEEFLVQKSVINNVKVLNDELGLISIAADSLSTTVIRLANSSACFLDKTAIFTELMSLSNYLDGIFDTIAKGEVSTRLIPETMLKNIFKLTSMEDNCLIAAQPLNFYREAKVSLLSVDKEKLSVRFLLVSPRIEQKAHYVRLDIRTASSTIKLGEEIYNRKLTFDSTSLGIPYDLFHRKDFELNKLTREELNSLRITSNCATSNGYYSCKDFYMVPKRQLDCLEGLLRGGKELLSACDIDMQKQTRHVTASFDRGLTGILVSTTSSHTIYGIDENRVPTMRKTDLTNMLLRDPNFSICIFVPNSFTKIQVVGLDDNITLVHDTHIYARPGVVSKLSSYGKHHYTWYRNNYSVNNITKGNFTHIDLAMKRLITDMEQHRVIIRRITGWVFSEYLLYICVLHVVIFWLIVFFIAYRKCKRKQSPSDVDKAFELGQSLQMINSSQPVRRSFFQRKMKLRRSKRENERARKRKIVVGRERNESVSSLDTIGTRATRISKRANEDESLASEFQPDRSAPPIENKRQKNAPNTCQVCVEMTNIGGTVKNDEPLVHEAKV